MSTSIAKSVSSLDELYSKACIDWNFEFKRHNAKNQNNVNYIAIMAITEGKKAEDGGKGEKKDSETVVGPQLDEAERPDLHYTRTADTMHWYNLLPWYASKVQVMRIQGLKLDGGDLLDVTEYNMLQPADAGKLSAVLDDASTIYVYDAERDFALLRRIQDDDAIVTGHVKSREETSKDVDVNKLEYVRLAPWFFDESEMIHWRHRTRDVRGTFPTKKHNKGIGFQQLLANHVADDSQIDSRGGVFVLYQVVCMTFVNGQSWDHISLEHADDI